MAAAGIVVIVAGIFLFGLRKPRVVRESGLNVVLITLDTTRADRLGAYGYAGAGTPYLDDLAANGVRFERAYAPAPLTLPSHATIMTGLHIPGHGVHNNGSWTLGPEKTTLAEILRDEGASTAAFVASFSVDSRFGLDQGFDLYDDRFQEGSPFKAVNAERKAEQVFALFDAWMDKRGDERFFAWVHFFDPHLPYSPPSPYREQFASSPYDGEIAYMDFMVGQVVNKLRDRNLLGRTLVVVAGDHGEAFGEKGEAGHGVFLYEMTLKVPLILYAEGRLPAGLVVQPRVRLADIMPTVLDLLEIPAPEGLQGESLLPYVRKSKRRDLDVLIETFYPKENYGWSALTGLVSGPWKYIQAPRPELYDLDKDPGEMTDLHDSDPKTAAALKARLEESVAASGFGTASGPRTLTAEEKARLRSLGYVDYSDPASSGDDDPKDKLDELKMIQDAESAEYEGRFDEAAALHERMLALRPNTASSYINLALSRARLKDFDQAVAVLQSGLEVLPGNELLMSRLGYTYLVMGRLDEAVETMSDLLTISPRSLDALIAIAVILDGQGRKVEARGFFERALSIEPENKFLRQSHAGVLASMGSYGEAIEAFEALLEDYPRDLGLYRAIGIAYGMRGDYDKAIDSFKEMTYISPVPDAFYNLAVSYRQKGDLAEAVRWFERYLEDPKDEPAQKVQIVRTELARLRALLDR